MTDLADPLDHFLAAKAAAVAALDELERIVRKDEGLRSLPAFPEVTDTLRDFAQKTAGLNKLAARRAAATGDAA